MKSKMTMPVVASLSEEIERLKIEKQQWMLMCQTRKKEAESLREMNKKLRAQIKDLHALKKKRKK